MLSAVLRRGRGIQLPLNCKPHEYWYTAGYLLQTIDNAD